MDMIGNRIRNEIVQKLLESEALSLDRINVMTKGNSIVLRGEVQSHRRKLLAQQICESCEQVESVFNELRVAPPETLTDRALANRINQALLEEPRLSDKAIRVDIRNGTVTLSGYVTDEREKTSAADIALGTVGSTEINNLLIENPDKVEDNQRHAAEILSAIGSVIGMEDEEICLTVVDETARLSGAVDALWKKDSAEKTVRSKRILSVCNEISVKGPTARN